MSEAHPPPSSSYHCLALQRFRHTEQRRQFNRLVTHVHRKSEGAQHPANVERIHARQNRVEVLNAFLARVEQGDGEEEGEWLEHTNGPFSSLSRSSAPVYLCGSTIGALRCLASSWALADHGSMGERELLSRWDLDAVH